MSQTLFPKFSKNEMQRRFGAVKRAMLDRGLDCLIVAGSSARWNEKYANIRYLTEFVDKEISCSYLVFPLEGEPTLLVWGSHRLGNVREMSLVQDIRPVHPYYVDAIVDKIKELKLEKATIGIEGYDRHIQIPYDHFEQLRNRLSSAGLRFVHIVEGMRLIKSDEEIRFMQKAGELSDLAARNMVETTRPGMRDSEVYANIDHAIAMNGGEAPSLINLGSTPMAQLSVLSPNITPSARTICRGDIIFTEITAKYAGYWEQTIKPVALGHPPSNIVRMHEVARRAYDVIAEQLFPGNSYQAVLKAGREALGNVPYIGVDVHGIGMESPEEPTTWLDKLPVEPIEIREGMCFKVATNRETEDGKMGAMLGSTFFVTKTGSTCFNKYAVAELAII